MFRKHLQHCRTSPILILRAHTNKDPPSTRSRLSQANAEQAKPRDKSLFISAPLSREGQALGDLLALRTHSQQGEALPSLKVPPFKMHIPKLSSAAVMRGKGKAIYLHLSKNDRIPAAGDKARVQWRPGRREEPDYPLFSAALSSRPCNVNGFPLLFFPGRDRHLPRRMAPCKVAHWSRCG